jgi:hypothetical protein
MRVTFICMCSHANQVPKLPFFLIMCRMFAAIKKDILSMCSGTCSLPDDCSGWSLLQHCLPLHHKKEKFIINDAACRCSISVPSTASISEDSKELWNILFPKECVDKMLLPQEEHLPANQSHVFMLACCAVLASKNLQQKVNAFSPLRVAVVRASPTSLSMRIAIQPDNNFIAREEEHTAIVDAVKSVMVDTSRAGRSVLLLNGNPGLGKSVLAKQALISAQKEVQEGDANALSSWEVCIHIVR